MAVSLVNNRTNIAQAIQDVLAQELALEDLKKARPNSQLEVQAYLGVMERDMFRRIQMVASVDPLVLSWAHYCSERLIN